MCAGHNGGCDNALQKFMTMIGNGRMLDGFSCKPESKENKAIA
ncbi:hypothetical protein ACE1TH_11440 [Shouchella sp. JSM 1781072]